MKERKVKTPLGKKMPTQGRSARGKKITQWLKMKVSQITLRWAALKVYNGCKNPAIFHGRVRDDVGKKNVNEEQQQNEEHQQMKNNNITKTSLEVLPSKVTSLGVFGFNKNDYISVISITFICCQFRGLIKIMTDVENILNDDQFFGDVVDTPKEGIEQHVK